jgi:hypothetical protein
MARKMKSNNTCSDSGFCEFEHPSSRGKVLGRQVSPNHLLQLLHLPRKSHSFSFPTNLSLPLFIWGVVREIDLSGKCDVDARQVEDHKSKLE